MVLEHGVMHRSLLTSRSRRACDPCGRSSRSCSGGQTRVAGGDLSPSWEQRGSLVPPCSSRCHPQWIIVQDHGCLSRQRDQHVTVRGLLGQWRGRRRCQGSTDALLNVPSIAPSNGEGRWGGVRSGVKTRGHHAEETTRQGADALAWATQMSRVACRVGGAACSRPPSAPHLRPSCHCVAPSCGRRTHHGLQVRCQMDWSGLLVSPDGSRRATRGGEAHVRLHSESTSLRLRERRLVPRVLPAHHGACQRSGALSALLPERWAKADSVWGFARCSAGSAGGRSAVR